MASSGSLFYGPRPPSPPPILTTKNSSTRLSRCTWLCELVRVCIAGVLLHGSNLPAITSRYKEACSRSRAYHLPGIGHETPPLRCSQLTLQPVRSGCPDRRGAQAISHDSILPSFRDGICESHCASPACCFDALVTLSGKHAKIARTCALVSSRTPTAPATV